MQIVLTKKPSYLLKSELAFFSSGGGGENEKASSIIFNDDGSILTKVNADVNYS